MEQPTGIRWRVLVLLAIVSFVSYVLRYNISIASTAMKADLHLTEQQLGYILAAFTAGYTIFQFPGGVFGLKLGPRRAMTIIAVLWGLLTLLTSGVPAGAGTAATMIMLIGVRFLVGAVHAPIYPLTGGVVERWFPIGRWALPNGLSSAALTLGVAATGPVLPYMLDRYGWRASFLMLAPLGFAAAFLWWWYVRDRPAEHPGVNDGEAALIAANRPANRPATVEPVGRRPGWLRVLGSRDMLLLTLSYFCMNYIFGLMFNWIYYYLVEVREFDPRIAGYATSVQWIAGATGAALGGLVCDGLCRRYGVRWGCAWPAASGLVLSGVFLLIGAVSGDPHVAVICLALSFLSNQMTEGAFWAGGISIGGRNAAAACGVLNTGGNSAGFVNALLVPFTAKALGWTAAMVTGTLFAFAAAALWLFIRAEKTVPD
jgi:ACS family glucarate transporter-like MFS transporter